MRLFNTLTRSLEDFAPAEAGHVRMYNCGPTVYGDQHVGNYRTFAFGDTLRRYFEYRGMKVTQVVNITDVGHLTQNDLDTGEDKIIKKARELGWTPVQVAGHFTERFLRDRKKLLFLEPEQFSKATDHIPEMISLIKTLLDKGVAYAVGGNVYFEVTKFPGYGKLSGNSLETLRAGARIGINPEKRHPADFALWKTDEKHLMQWEAPWGRGFPGWHVECSAMSMKYLGETFDIHTGGEDNIFPHHECEIAQSEAATGKPFVRFWLHARHLRWKGAKLAKSTGNLMGVEELVGQGFTPAEIRYVLVSTRYRQQVNLSLDLFSEARTALGRLLEFKRRLREAAATPDSDVALDLDAVRRGFEERMDDDLDTAGALGALHVFAREGNEALDRGLSGSAAKAALDQLDRIDGVFGVLADPGEEKPPDEVVRMAEQRIEARKRRDFPAADALRDQVKALGWSIEDGKDGMRVKKL